MKTHRLTFRLPLHLPLTLTLTLTFLLPPCFARSTLRDYPDISPCEVVAARAHYLIAGIGQKIDGLEPRRQVWTIVEKDYAERFYHCAPVAGLRPDRFGRRSKTTSDDGDCTTWGSKLRG